MKAKRQLTYYFIRRSWRPRARKGTDRGLSLHSPQNNSCLSLRWLFFHFLCLHSSFLPSSSMLHILPLHLSACPPVQGLFCPLPPEHLFPGILCLLPSRDVKWQCFHLPGGKSFVSLCHSDTVISPPVLLPGGHGDSAGAPRSWDNSSWNAQWRCCPVSLFKWIIETTFFSDYKINKYLSKIQKIIKKVSSHYCRLKWLLLNVQVFYSPILKYHKFAYITNFTYIHILSVLLKFSSTPIFNSCILFQCVTLPKYTES